MKKLILLLLTITTIFSSCKNDDKNNDDNPTNKILGTWILVSDYTKEEGGGWIEDEELIECQKTLQFKTDNIVVIRVEYFNNDDENYPDEVTTSTYSIEGNKISILFSESTIEKLTETELIVTSNSDAYEGRMYKSVYRKQ